MVSPRGQSPFAAHALREAVDEAPFETIVGAEHLTEYLSFYGLDGLAQEHAVWVVSCGAFRVAAQVFRPETPRGTAFLCHGYYDHVGLYGYLLEYLLERDIAVIAYDQLGHGLSSGERVTIDSFDEYVEANQAVLASAERMGFGVPNHWFGQSMGGAVLLEYLHQHEDEKLPGEVVLFAPLVRPHNWFVNRWVFALAKLTITERARTIVNNAENPDFLTLQAKDPLQDHVLPVRWVQAMVDWFGRFERYPPSQLAPKIIQGDADRTVSWRYNLRVMRHRFPQADVHIIPNARHHMVNEAPELREHMWDWLDRECNWAAV